MPMPRFTTWCGRKLQGGTARNDLALGQAHRQHAVHGHTDLGRERRVVGLGEGLLVVRRVDGHHHRVDQHAGHLDLARMQRAALGDALHLSDHHAARVARGHGDGQRLQSESLALHREVAVRIGRGGTDDAHLDRKGLVEQVVLAIDRHDTHQILGGARIELATAVTRIHKRVQPDPRERAGLAGGDVAKQVRDHTLRQTPGFDQVVHREFLHRRHQAPVPADHAAQQAGVAQVVEASRLPIALASGVDQGQVARLLGGHIALFQRHGNGLGKADADKAAGGHRVAVMDQLHRLGRADDLVLVGAVAGVVGLDMGGHGRLGAGRKEPQGYTVRAVAGKSGCIMQETGPRRRLISYLSWINGCSVQE
jgi:hypothetical protein